MIRKKSSINLMITLVLLNFSGCMKESGTNPSENKEVIKIGYLTEITGAVTVTGATESAGFHALEVAASEINAAGGILGKNVEFVLKDSYANEGEAALTSVKEFHDDEIDFVVGPGWSSRTLKIADYTIANNMLIMPFSATSPLISELKDNGLVWRICPSDILQSKAAADYIYNTMGIRKVGIMYRNDGWGVGVATSFKTSYEGLGGTIVSNVDYPAETEDFSTYDFSEKCDALLTGSPELIFYASFGDDQFKWLNDISAKEAYKNTKPKFFDVDGLSVNGLLVNVPSEMIDDIMAIGFAVDKTPNSNFMKYREAHLAQYPNDGLDAFVAGTYDIAYLMAYAMIKANSTDDAAKVAACLKDISGGAAESTIINVNEYEKAKSLLESGKPIDYNGASGKVEFDDNGDPGHVAYAITKIENSQEVTIKTIQYPK